MKNIKKIFSSFLVALMCVQCLAVSVNAQNVVDPTDTDSWLEIADYGTISVSNTYSNKTYGGGYKGTGIDVVSKGTAVFGKTLTEPAAKIEFDHSSAVEWRSLGTDGATVNIEEYKDKAYFVFDVYVDVAEGVTEWGKVLSDFTIGTSMPVNKDKPTTGSTYVKALRSANLASKIKAVTPKTWTTIEVPFDDTWTEQGWTSAIKIGATALANQKDVDIYLTNMGFYTKRPAPKASIKELGLTSSGEKCVRISYEGTYAMGDSAKALAGYKLVDSQNAEYTAKSVTKVGNSDVYEIVFNATFSYPASYKVKIADTVLDTNGNKVDKTTRELAFSTPVVADKAAVSTPTFTKTADSVTFSGNIVVTEDVQNPKVILIVEDANKNIIKSNEGAIGESVTVSGVPNLASYKIYAFITDGSGKPLCKNLQNQ